MYAEEIHPQEKVRFRFSNHPWISLVALNFTGILMIVLVVIVTNLIGVSENASYRPLIIPTLAHLLMFFVIAPFVFQLPNGKTTFRKYLDDIRLSKMQPFLPC